jgi:spore coat polysaccharide biosynthesis protein SpsF
MPKLNVVAIVQARMGSTRLPGKMLMRLVDRPVIAWSVQRVRLSRDVNSVVVATSRSAGDDALARHCSSSGIPVFRGSEVDVLDRYYRCALEQGATHVVRVTGDSPLVDPRIIDATVALSLADEGVDYATNAEPMTYPEGMGVEVMPFGTLETAWRESALPSHREHVTPFVRFHPERFRHAVLRAEPDLSHVRLTIDYPDDLAALEELVGILRTRGFDSDSSLDFSLDEILAVLDETPSIRSLLGSKSRDLWRQEVARDEGRPAA